MTKNYKTLRGVFPLNITARAPKIFEGLKKKRVKKPWGAYTVLVKEFNCKIKRIVVNPGAKLSLHKHERRSDHWIFLNGLALVTHTFFPAQIERERLSVTFHNYPGTNAVIGKGEWHRVENIGKDPLVFIEVQTGDYFGKDDIIKMEDDYGRKGSTNN